MTGFSRGDTPRPPQDIIVVGGGVIGTAIAWQAAKTNTVIQLDPQTDDKASLVAAGMLGPVSEAVFGEQYLLNLNLHAVDCFPGFNAELEAAAGQPTGLRTEGTLAVAYDSGDLAALDRLTEFRLSIGLKAERLTAREVRQREPFLAPGTKGGVLALGDLSVDNRRYLAALRIAAVGAGVQTVKGRVTQVTDDGQVTLEDGTTLTGQTVVIAAGHATPDIKGVPEPVRKALRPVKGQILRLRHPKDLPHLLTHTVRALVRGRDIYLVPRADGELVIGSTQEERDDRDVTAGGLRDLLDDATMAVPALTELIFAEASAGLRPGTSDNGPVLGKIHSAPNDSGRVILAAGHFRNGILLSAATAEAVTALLAGWDPHLAWTPFTPGRFT